MVFKKVKIYLTIGIKGFYYRQFPLYDKLFLDAGSLYSLRLFELAEYMNSLKIIPKW